MRRRRSFVDLSEGEVLLRFGDYLARFGHDSSLAPNLDEDKQQAAVAFLSSITQPAGTTVFVLCEKQGSSDRIILFTTAKAREIREWAEQMSADRAARLSAQDAQRVRAQFGELLGAGWCIVRDSAARHPEEHDHVPSVAGSQRLRFIQQTTGAKRDE